MDTSKEYIEMCEEAEEIQDYYKKNDFGGDEAQDFSLDGNWLPRQDQLQKMIGDYEEQIRAMQHLFTPTWGAIDFSEYQQHSANYWPQFTSMEQLWLAFVMKEKYNKVWNGKEWI